MGRINGKNTGKTGVFPHACSPFGLNRVLIRDAFRPESPVLTMPPASHPHSISRSIA